MSRVSREAPADWAGKRLDVVLGSWPELASRSAAARLADAGRVTVDGVAANKNHLVQEGELIVAEPEPVCPFDVTPEPIPLDVVFEDDELIVLSKPAGLVVHPAQGNWSGTLVNALAYHFTELGLLQGPERPGIVHRLDKDTSGLMLAAKRDETQAALQDAIRQRLVDRRYLCLVHGRIGPDTGIIDAPLARDAHDRHRRAVSDHPSAKSAVTTFTVLERFEPGLSDDGYTLVECKLFTGRTHQIRVHLAYTGHPVVGDPLYGRRAKAADRGLTRQFLHSYSLALTHPVTGVDMRFTDALPADLRTLLDELRPLSEGRTAAGEEILGQVGGKGGLSPEFTCRSVGEGARATGRPTPSPPPDTSGDKGI
ncbi:MAG: RluA family pseudouridine synthase [Actinomycetia bacterium]|nr:RluA family pseudouridine synthase [Actinomycetes bacterium]